MVPNGSSLIHKSLPPLSILNQTNSVCTFPSHILKVHFNIILSPTPMSSKWSLSFRLNHQNSVYLSPVSHFFYMLPALNTDLISWIIYGEE